MRASLLFAGPDTMSCMDTAYVTAGSPTELWGTTWTYADINFNERFGVRVKNDGCTGTGVDSIRVTVHFRIPGQQCADGYLTGDEECDDGNFTRGDGCSFGCEVEQALEPDEQKCVTYVNKFVATLSKLAAKVGAKCAKAVYQGTARDFAT